MEYGHWVEKQNTEINELRSALQAHVSDIELQMLVESGMSHYDDLFHIKAIAAKSDVFYLMSGMWKTSAERFFLWIGGFRPSELLKVSTYVEASRLDKKTFLCLCKLALLFACVEYELTTTVFSLYTKKPIPQLLSSLLLKVHLDSLSLLFV